MSKQNSFIFVPQRFKDVVALHLVKNMIQVSRFRTPLILGIHGPSGAGKTFQCETVFREMQVQFISLSGKDFESEIAGEPSKLLCKRYLEASDLVLRRTAPCVTLFINDLDAGIGNWGDKTQYTVNTQLVNATLMNIADHPEHVDGRKTARIPIIVTGNNFTTLYEPLTREGRMVAFEWKPTFDEKVEIVRRIFYELLSDEDVQSFVNAFQEKPIAFFSLLKSKLFDEQILGLIHQVGLSSVVRTMRQNGFYEQIREPRCNLDMLIEMGKTLVESGELVNHLSRKQEVVVNAYY